MALAGRSGLFHWRNRSWRGGFDGRSHGGGDWSTPTVAASASGRAAAVAVSIDNIVSAQAKSLFGLTSDTTIAVTQSTGQGGHDFWAAAAVLANLIANLISSSLANSFISVVQTVDEGRHDFWVADAIIAVAEFAKSSGSLLRIAGRLRRIDQLGDIAGIRVAGTGFDSRAARSSGSTAAWIAWSTAGGSTS